MILKIYRYRYIFIHILYIYCYLKTNQGRIVILEPNLYNQLIVLNLQSHKEAYEAPLHFQWDLMNMWNIPSFLQLLAFLSHVLLSYTEFYEIIEINIFLYYYLHNT